MADLLEAQRYPAEWHEFILEMMMDPDVGLCFPLGSARQETYLLPEALPENRPNLEIWKNVDQLRFRYEYEFLPRGLVPRFIVQSHRNLTSEPTRWRDGVLLEACGCNVLVYRPNGISRIDISVTGPAARRRSALNVVLNDLDFVHRLNPEITPEARVPLPDRPGISVGYKHLLNLEVRRGLDYEFEPDGTEDTYTVRELLEGVRLDRFRQETIVNKFGDHTTFHGDFNVTIAKKIQDSFNKAQSARSSDAVKAVLQQLSQEVGKLAEKLPQEKAVEVADDLQKLTDEATKPSPVRKYWEFSAKGIAEAAQSLGAAGTVVIELVNKLLPLLAGPTP